MPRRLLPTLVALGCGLLALGWGLLSLLRIFAQEREDARAQLSSRRDTLEQYASEALRRTLAGRLAEKLPAIHAAMGDPLAPDEGYLIHFRGHPFLPRLTVPNPGTETPAQRAYEVLTQGLTGASVPAPWPERLARLRATEEALASGRKGLAGTRIAELLRYHAANPLPPAQELPFLLLTVERLQRGSSTSPLIHALLREGLPDDMGGVARWAGLQRELLRQRNRLTEADFSFLSARVEAVSEALGERTDDFLARAREVGPGALVLPEDLSAAVLLGESWYIEPRREDVVVGLSVDLPALLGTISADLRERNLLGRDERVFLPPGALLPVESVRLRMLSPQADAAEAAIEQRHGLKSLLVAICGGLAVAIVVLAAAAQQRKFRYLELKSDFVATVSHELRTPVASIRLLTETLERRFGASPEARDYFGQLLQTTDGLHFLIENVLSFNRIDKGRWAPRRARVRLDELASTLHADVSGAAKVPVRLSVDVGDVELDVDPSLIRLLLSNLGRNACAYNERDPVELSLRAYAEEGGECTVLFKDNGRGIPESEWERVFQEFYRLTPDGPEVHGSGLGLALCQRIMALHGGSLRITASSPQGTTFALTFPAPRR
ncbi:HAMP domain-containing sensor histidine kinase [Myxococcaceae bacterium GXIMD 01537]